MYISVFYALLAAALFGASTPLAKLLVGSVSPVLLGGLLYLGSGIGLTAIRLVRDRGWVGSGLGRDEWPWLLGAIFFGGVLGPVALMFGLVHTKASDASLLLNLESVLTAVLAWTVFKENADRRIVVGMVVIVLGGVLLSWPDQRVAANGNWLGPGTIALACLCWAVDNNLTRKVSTTDALFVAGSKGLIAGLVNCAVALSMGTALPTWGTVASTMVVGWLGYGISLVLFVMALRGLGTARTGAYFSMAPFVGAAVALVLLREAPSLLFWPACALMGVGVWLHLTERHMHLHTHEPLEHSHRHVHDEHHLHEHGPDCYEREPHTHWHRHQPITHSHPHFPDIHHRHPHG